MRNDLHIRRNSQELTEILPEPLRFFTISQVFSVGCRCELYVGTLYCNFIHCEFWPYLNFVALTTDQTLLSQLLNCLSVQLFYYSKKALQHDNIKSNDFNVTIVSAPAWLSALLKTLN